MKILVVGNVFKDVYLNIDERSEKFETDAGGTKWLNLGFNASEHRFFRGVSSFAGAVISLEVLGNMGFEAEISGSGIKFEDDGINAHGNSVADIYRYILVSDEQLAYFTPSFEHKTNFIAPKEPVDYIFIDRSSNLVNYQAILDYLEAFPETKLAIHVHKDIHSGAEEKLISRADLVFSEQMIEDLPERKLVFISDKKITYAGMTEKINIPRTDMMTHLSAYSILAATILGGILNGNSVKKSLRLAKVNVENSSLDATLSLSMMEELAA